MMQIADPDPAGVGIPGRNEDEEEYSNYDDEYIETSICGFDIMLKGPFTCLGFFMVN